MRRLAENASALLDAGFRFDGTTSDLAQQLYRRFLANVSIPQISLANATLPDAIQSRLTAVGSSFTDLPGLLQRALIWDSGFAISPNNDLVRIQTLNGVSMANIALSFDAYRGAGCKAQNCTQPDGLKWYKSLECNGAQIMSASHCLADDFEGGDGVHLSMWATGGVDTATPEMRILKHVWSEGPRNYSVPAIHTATKEKEPAYFNCGADNQPTNAPGIGSIVIACYTKDVITKSMLNMMKPPAQGKIVTAWLQQYGTKAGSQNDSNNASSSSSSSGFNKILLVPIVVGVLLVIGVLIWFLRRKKRDDRDKSLAPTPGVDPGALLSPAYDRYPGKPGADSYDATQAGTVASGMTSGSGGKPSIYSDDYDSSGSNSVMRILMGDPNLVGRQLPYEKIHFDRLLSKGAFGEVWECQFEDQVLAVKRMLPNKRQSFQDVEDFTREIQLTASLDHPNIVRFVGVAWNSLENLVMAIEYLPAGDLCNYLRKNGDLLTWPREKITMARGLASAIEYMHARTPVLIHRDLKSKNVLLSEQLEVKLIDFGVSRGKKDMTMTAGVGTPLWTAPEVLEGKRYTEKSDIYSFGVLVTELDTCDLPFANAIGDDGHKIKHFQILNMVMAGTLRPKCSMDCPRRIQRVVRACLQHDPALRPSAPELLQMLDGESGRG